MTFSRSSFGARGAVALASLLAMGHANSAPIELFEQPQFRGATLGLDRAAARLSDWGFDDLTGSMIVRHGQWELCIDPDFRGTCRTFGPGEYPNLPPGMVRSLSSARPLQGGEGGGAWVGNAAPLTLFEDGGLHGRRLEVTGAMVQLPGFNDEASSVEIRRGRWQLCTDGSFRGTCIVLGAGRHELTGRMHDEVSSVRPVFGPTDQPLPPTGGVTLFSGPDFSGRSVLVIGPTDSLGRFDFNDAASSVEVHGGQWEFCRHAQFRVPCFVLGPGRHLLGQGAQDSVTSLRPVMGRPVPVPGRPPVMQEGPW